MVRYCYNNSKTHVVLPTYHHVQHLCGVGGRADGADDSGESDAGRPAHDVQIRSRVDLGIGISKNSILEQKDT